MRTKSTHTVKIDREGARYITATRHSDGVDVEILNDPRKPEMRFTIGVSTAFALSQALADVSSDAVFTSKQEA